MIKLLAAAAALTAVAFAQVDTTKTTFTSAKTDGNRFETFELLPAAATQLCSQSTASVTRTSGTALSIGTGSSASAPQQFRFGNQTRAITAAVTATISSGSATGTVDIWAYLNGGSLALGVINPTSNVITCSGGIGCTVAAPGSTLYPTITKGIKLWSWSVSVGTYALAGGTQLSIGSNCWIDQLYVVNVTGSAVTFTLTDNQAVPFALFQAVSILANQTMMLVGPGGTFFEGGVLVTSGTASALNLKARGTRVP